jgi:REP element-mobilizing transposase RayT
MLRGIDRMALFLDNEDRTRFLNSLDRMKKDEQYEIFAYCLMSNHVHLLIKEGKDAIERSMKRIGVSYSYYFNKKYNRVGHIFQDRFRSEAIEDDAYLLIACRYIHNNPVKGGIVGKANDYQWSSYHDYINLRVRSERVNTRFILEMLSENDADAVKRFIEFTDVTKTDDELIDIENRAEKNEKHDNSCVSAQAVIVELLKHYSYKLDDIRSIKNKSVRNDVLRYIKSKSSISVRDLANILGISKDIIFRA